MTNLGNNIKIIRALCKKTQTQFAALFKDLEDVTEAMQKSYESGKAKPSILYMERLAELSGATVRNLSNAQLGRGSLKINTDLLQGENVEKVNGSPPISAAQHHSDLLAGAHITLQDYINEIKHSRDMLFTLVNSGFGKMFDGQRLATAYQKAWIEYEAERAAQGDSDKKEEIMYKMGKLVDEYLHRETLFDIRGESDKNRKA